MRKVIILGSTGSIGTQALQVIEANPGRFEVFGLAAGGGNVQLLAQQCAKWRPQVVAVANREALEPLREVLSQLAAGYEPQFMAGSEAPAQLAGYLAADGVSHAEACGPAEAGHYSSTLADIPVVLNGITGGVGLAATLAALRSGATLALANKESLVVGGALVKQALRRPGQVVPVDSEHSAIAQCLTSGVHNRGLTSINQDGRSELAQIVLTASGGPFRGKKRSELREVTPEMALNHPTWKMGPVVTLNSSTLVNKGLELIEAHLLFDVEPEKIVPVIHPSSIVHSMVTWQDGATMAQASTPDMRLPIALGLDWPRRLAHVEPPLDFTRPQAWEFEPVDHETFPTLLLAREAVAAGPTYPAVYNAANEVYVEQFLAGNLPYLGIFDGLAQALETHDAPSSVDLETIMQVQTTAKAHAAAFVESYRA